MMTTHDKTNRKLHLGAWMAVCLLACAIQIHAATFKVSDYGAVGDDKTDNTAAFSKCMTAIIAAGGGQMYLPDGVYRGRIVIPPVSKPVPSWITVEIVGESEPPVVWGTIGNFPPQDHGTIVKCLDKSGAAVISASPSSASLYGGFSAVYVVIRNLDVRSYDNPAIAGIDLGSAMQCRLENVFVNTGIYNVQSSEPTHGTVGLVTPANNNAALTLLRNVAVTGYHTGILVNEHTDGDNITLGSNFNGLDFATANHASRFGRVCAQRNTHAVNVSGRHGFLIEQLNIEKTGPGQTDAKNQWQSTDFDLNDPGNLGIGDIRQWVVRGAVGSVDDFTRNGATGIQCERIGTAPRVVVESGINGSFEVPAVNPGSYLEIPVGGSVGGWSHASGSVSAWIVDETYISPQLPAAVDGRQMLELDHRSAPKSLIVRSLGVVDAAGDVKVSARFALRDFNVGPPLPAAKFHLLLLTGAPGNFTTLVDSGPLSHTAAKTWVEHSVTAPAVAACTEIFVGLEADAAGTADLPVFTLVDDVKKLFSSIIRK